MVRIPFFGSEWMYLDLVFFVLNIKNRTDYIFNSMPLKNFVGDFIHLSQVFKDTPSLQSLILQYDISSQVKENLLTFQTIEAREYGLNPTDTHAVGYKIVGSSLHIDMSNLIHSDDVTISYYHTNPILCYKKN